MGDSEALITDVEIGNIWTWIFIWLDLFAVWLLVRPPDVLGPLTAYGIRFGDWDRFFARLAGAILLGAQITRWDNQAKNTNAQPIMRWFSVVAAVCAVLFLGYHFVRLFTTEPGRETQVEGPERRYLLPESEEEARVRYRAAWQKYRRLRVLFPLAFLGWLPFALLVMTVFGFLHWNPYIGMTLIFGWIPLISIFGWQWALWKCPRCGFAFKGPLDSFFPKRCQYCNLPMWAESPDE